MQGYEPRRSDAHEQILAVRRCRPVARHNLAPHADLALESEAAIMAVRPLETGARTRLADDSHRSRLFDQPVHSCGACMRRDLPPPPPPPPEMKAKPPPLEKEGKAPAARTSPAAVSHTDRRW